MPCYWHQVAKHYMRDWQFVRFGYAMFLKDSDSFPFPPEFDCFLTLQWINQQWSSMAFQLAGDLQHELQDGWAHGCSCWRCSWTCGREKVEGEIRGAKTHGGKHAMTVFCCCKLIIRSVYKAYLMYMTFMVQTVPYFLGKQCGYAVRACSHLAYLSQWFRSTLVTWYIPHPQVGGYSVS